MSNLYPGIIIQIMNQNIHGIFTIIFTVLLTLLIPVTSSAQMFSVGDPEPVRERVPGLYSVLSVGWEFASFDFTGETIPGEDRLDFDDSLIRFRLDTPGLDISLGVGGKLTGMNENSLVNVNARLSNRFSLYRREKVNLTVPFQITTDLLRVSRNSSDTEFQQSSLTLGAGLESAIRLSNRIDFSIKGTPNYGFSFSQGNLFGGSLFRLDGKALLYFRNLIGNNSLSLGYHFDMRKYDIDGNLSDYDFTSHSLTIGYAF
jgi:hypothetical protein